jgi:serine/threonine-protein kinase
VIGQTLKHYRVESLIGTGGMGEVYQAKDTKLGRAVAVKVLPETIARDPERISRFEREARLLAAMNHPNIAALYGMEEADGRHFLVMELVEGETLAERLRRGPIPVVETLKTAQQIVEALEAAHDKGIIHRDLKPANVKFTREGKVKVLDFGLAKAMETRSAGGSGTEAFSNSPTVSMAATNAGIILGTAAYMSPEQANGLAADTRSDLFSLGSVLYEMLSGRQPFQGKTLSEVLASVLVREPDWNSLPPNLHPRVYELLRRCLEKDPRRRWHAAGDVRVEIEKLLADPGGLEEPSGASSVSKPLWRRAIPVLGAAIVGAFLTAVAFVRLSPAPPQPLVARFSITLPRDQGLNDFNVPIALSADSTKLVYVTSSQLFLRNLAEAEARPVTGTMGAGTPVLFSPDGQWIFFWSFTDGELRKVAVTGGASIRLCKCPQPMGITWHDNHILWGEAGKGIMRLSEDGGEPETLVSIKTGELAHGPQVLDDGRAMLFTLSPQAMANEEAWDAAQIVVQPLPAGERKVLVRGGSDGRYLPTGHLLYALGRNILAVLLDPKTLEPRGSPAVVLEGVMRPASFVSGAAGLTLSDNGTLAYVPADISLSTRNVLAMADKTGKIETLPLPPGDYRIPRISPNGKQIAFEQHTDQNSSMWIYEPGSGRQPRKLTFDANSSFPVWSSDSQRVIFHSGNLTSGSIVQQRADGTGPTEKLTKPEPGLIQIPQATFGNLLAFTPFRNNTGGISILSLLSERKIESFVEIPGTVQVHAEFSSDGRWLAYMSTEGGAAEIFIKPFPRTEAKYQITTAGGITPLWSSTGKQLFYVNQGRLYVADIQTESTPSVVGTPSELPIRGAIFPAPGLRNYDVTKDGRFLIVTPAAPDSATQATAQIHFVLNWLEELKQRVPVQ